MRRGGDPGLCPGSAPPSLWPSLRGAGVRGHVPRTARTTPCLVWVLGAPPTMGQSWGSAGEWVSAASQSRRPSAACLPGCVSRQEVLTYAAGLGQVRPSCLQVPEGEARRGRVSQRRLLPGHSPTLSSPISQGPQGTGVGQGAPRPSAPCSCLHDPRSPTTVSWEPTGRRWRPHNPALPQEAGELSGQPGTHSRGIWGRLLRFSPSGGTQGLRQGTGYSGRPPPPWPLCAPHTPRLLARSGISSAEEDTGACGQYIHPRQTDRRTGGPHTIHTTQNTMLRHMTPYTPYKHLTPHATNVTHKHHTPYTTYNKHAKQHTNTRHTLYATIYNIHTIYTNNTHSIHTTHTTHTSSHSIHTTCAVSKHPLHSTHHTHTTNAPSRQAPAAGWLSGALAQRPAHS